jgi:predicted hydrolase (HD superfamily)
MLAVGAAMRWYATLLQYDPDYWEGVGILHDFDWEIHPTLDKHPVEGAAILREKGVDPETIRVILSHYTEGTGVPREKPVDYALLACDEITGLIIATALIRPSKDLREVSVKSVRKKWRNRRFAAGVEREHVLGATDDFSRECFNGQLDLWTHIGNVLTAMKGIAAELDLDGRLAQEEEEAAS